VLSWKQPPLPLNKLGLSGEALAEDHLRGLGYQIVEKDVRTPLGQLDLVAMDGKTLVFVEVKTRAGHGYGLPQEAVDAKKIRKLRQLGLYYLKMRQYRGSVRFDVVGLTVADGRLVRVDHIKNAID
jgi:putative endonuclease